MTLPPTDKQDLEKSLDEKISEIQVRQLEKGVEERAKELGLSYADLRTIPINPSVVMLLDEVSAKDAEIAIISQSGKNLKVAVINPENQKTKSVLDKLTKDGYSLRVFVVSSISINRAWERYRLKKNIKESELGVISLKEEEISSVQKEIKDISDLKDRLSKLSITQVMATLVAGALKIDASDIHLEPEEKDVRLRYRIDGMLQDVVALSQEGYSQLLSRIKLISGLKINIHDSPQDGRFTIHQEGVDIEVRVSVLPGGYGENIVMRLLDPRKIRQNLEDLGMREDTLELIKKLLQKTTGAIITTGPTGSGKTTTLYAFINHVNSADIKIITIEDPIEYHVKGVSQTQVEPEAGYTFASGLRSIVRQDPDVILVGEIRDKETAEIAMQASLTGHLVFSTLHTNDAAGAVPRLIDLGVKPVTIAPAINAAMAQRLVRRLCPKCKKKTTISADDFELLGKYLKNLPSNVKIKEVTKNIEIYYPQKCKECNFTGYKDRIGVYEIFSIDPELEKLIIASPSISAIRDLAIKKGMTTILQDGLIKVVNGVTSTEEILRVVGE